MNDILKKIDELLIETETNLGDCNDQEDFFHFYSHLYFNLKEVMKNYEKVLEKEHFKQTEL